MDGRPRSRRSFLAAALTRAAGVWVAVTGGLAALVAGCGDAPQPKYGAPPERMEKLYGAPRSPPAPQQPPQPLYGAPPRPDTGPKPPPLPPPKYGAPPPSVKYGAAPPRPKASRKAPPEES